MNLDQAIAKVKTSSEPNASHAELFVRALASLGVLSLDAPMNGFQKVCDGLGWPLSGRNANDLADILSKFNLEIREIPS